MSKFFLLFIAALILFSCQKSDFKNAYSSAQVDSLKQSFKAHLDSTAYSFKTEEWSPLTEEDKAEFNGLTYYPYDISWRFQGKVNMYAQPDSMIIRGSREGDLRPAIKYGYFEFEKNGQEHQLQIIKIFSTRPERTAHLFLGFWDETSDDETYGGGRYIDIEENEENFYIVDFNCAYNPYCAYSARYSCAIPPFENRLNIPVTAGEKIFKEH